MRTSGNERGMTLPEVLIAITVLSIGVLAVMNALTGGYLNVASSGGQAKAATYGRQLLEQFKNQPFVPGPSSGSDTPSTGVTRSWTITPVGATPAPNRLARIVVTVTFNAGAGTQALAFETMRAE
jgi:prepilin-type N-terminal cleavage/methylation domain-containing protein